MANLIIIANDATIEDLSQVASARGRRIVVRFSDADVDVLERELQRATNVSGSSPAS